MSRVRTVVSAVIFCLTGTSLGAMPAHALVFFDQDIVAIFGDGNADDSWTADRSNGIEVGLRAKVRFDVSDNQPKNIFNSNGDGTYNHAAGAPPSDLGRPRWNFEWSINTDYDADDGQGGTLSNYLYLIEYDFDPGIGVSFESFDPINITDPFFPDHAIGTNATANGDGVSATDAANYANLIANNNVAQNSWTLSFFDNPPPLDPNVDGTYEFRLSVFQPGLVDLPQTPLAVVGIQVIVGAGAAVPEPASLGLMGVGLAGLIGLRRRKRG